MPRRAAGVGHSRSRWWRDTRLIAPALLSVVALFFVFAHFSVYTYAASFFSSADAATGGATSSLSVYLAIVGGASIVGLVISGSLANRWPRFGLSVYLAVFAFAMVAIQLPDPLRYAGLALWGLMFGTIGPVCQALAMKFTPIPSRAVISAAMVVMFNLGISMGAWAGGYVATTWHVSINPFVAAVALMFAAGLATIAGLNTPATNISGRWPTALADGGEEAGS